ncbi:MAG TPA: MFS transporter [Gaiellaceae bacterium]|nr:MFS transporter [Gaiellaceae bacterium]
MGRRLVMWPQGGLWRHPDFLRLWAGQTISQFGSQVSALALPIVAIVVLEASAFEVALLGTVEFLPFLLFTLPAGVWVDRLRRRPILIVADLGRAALLVSVPVAYGLDALTLWQLYAVGFAVGTLTVFFDVAYQSYLPSLVRRDQLVEGNSKLELSVSAGQLGGPAAAGGLISLITAPWAVLADAISFLGSAFFVLRIRKREDVVHPTAAAERPGMRAEVWEGLRFVFKDPRLRALTESTVIFNFCANGAFAVYLVYAVRTLGLSPAAIGVIFSLGNIGWLVGALVAGRLSARLGVGRTIVFTGLVAAPALMLVPAAPKSAPIPFLIAAGVINSFGLVIWRIAQVSLRQAITPDRMLGRVNAVSRFVMWGTIPLGTLLGGALGSTIGLRTTLWLGTIGASFTVLPVLLSPVRKIVSVPDQPEESEPDMAIGMTAVGMEEGHA